MSLEASSQFTTFIWRAVAMTICVFPRSERFCQTQPAVKTIAPSLLLAISTSTLRRNLRLGPLQMLDFKTESRPHARPPRLREVCLKEDGRLIGPSFGDRYERPPVGSITTSKRPTITRYRSRLPRSLCC